MVSPYVYAGLEKSAMKKFDEDQTEIKKNKIMNSVCSVFGITIYDLMSKKQTRNISEARQTCVAIIRRSCPNETWMDIGKLFKKHHSTLIYAVSVFDGLYETDRYFKGKIDTINSILND